MPLFWSKPKAPAESAFFTWNAQDFTVGIAAFDRDHQHLGESLNRIHGALIQRRDRLETSRLLDQFLQDVRRHFFQEEEALRGAHFPDLDAHAEEHALLLSQAQDMIRQFQSGSLSGIGLPGLLKSWLIGHIQESDRKYASCLRRNGMR